MPKIYRSTDAPATAEQGDLMVDQTNNEIDLYTGTAWAPPEFSSLTVNGAGTISGTVTASTISGTMQFSNNTGCTGSASVSGAASGLSLRWTIPTVASSNCN